MKTWLPALLIALVLALAEGFAEAQQATKVPRIGYLGLDDPSSSLFKSFREGLHELGYIEGQNIMIEPRFAYGNDWRLNGLAFELVGLNVNVIVAQSSQALNAARHATRTIPIVMTYPGDPVAVGIVASRERPGGNVTGISGMATELGGKWLELLKEAIPTVSRVGVLGGRGFENEATWKGMEVVARSLGVELQSADVQAYFGPAARYSRSRAVGAAFTSATRGQANAFILLPSLIFGQNLSYIADLGLKRHLPGIFWRVDFAEAGGFMSYGANETEQFRRAAYVVDKILKGAKPAELPVELPTKFELAINLKTAKEIGVTIHPEMLMFADRVIK
jgi:putative tryptophan/tyrosine transport system substrate-binding protein